MMSHFNLVRSVNFKEMPTLNQPLKSNSQEDLGYEMEEQGDGEEEIDNTIRVSNEDLKKYCKYILSNIKKMEIEDTEEFVNAMLVQTILPLSWLNCFEKLVNLNLLLLDGKANPLFLSTFHIFIDDKRKELEEALVYEDGLNIRRSNGTYSFKRVRFHLSKIDGFKKKILFLNRCKIEYQQFKPRYISVGTTPFDEKIELEIQRITMDEEFKSAKKEMENRTSVPSILKIKINSQINQFADIFYQMINDYKVNNLPLIETSNANVAKLISHFFTDVNGINIEQSTIETYLQKNKPEKRPKEYNRIRLS